MKGRTISPGKAEGEAIVSSESIGFYGGIDIKTGVVIEKGHPLEGKKITGKILVFPFGKGSTVGSYILYALKKNGKAPAALILNQCELIVAVGAIISEIPTVDQIDITMFKTNDFVTLDGDQIKIETANIH